MYFDFLTTFTKDLNPSVQKKMLGELFSLSYAHFSLLTG